MFRILAALSLALLANTQTITFFDDDTCATSVGKILTTPPCTNITALVSAAIGASPYVGLDIICSGPLAKGTVYWSLYAGYGDECTADSNKVDIPSSTSGTCVSVGIDGYGIGMEVVC